MTVKASYRNYMAETATAVNLMIEKSFEPLKKDPIFFLIFKSFIERRMQYPQLRPVITRLSYELLGGKNWKSIIPILVINEIQTMFLYLDNLIFDNKNNIWSGDVSEIRRKVNELTTASAVIREVLSDIISSSNIASEQKGVLEKSFSKSTQNCNYGQFIDLSLTIDRFGEFKTLEDFLEVYERKSRLQSGACYEASGFVGSLFGNGTVEQQIAITKICNLFGTGLHISNDLGDFAICKPSKTTFAKAYKDQQSDIRENRLTLPIFLVLKNGNGPEKRALENMIANYNPSQGELEAVVRSIHSTGAFSDCKRYFKRYYKQSKALLHENFDKGVTRDLFSVMLSVIRSNKFLTTLRNLK